MERFRRIIFNIFPKAKSILTRIIIWGIEAPVYKTRVFLFHILPQLYTATIVLVKKQPDLFNIKVLLLAVDQIKYRVNVLLVSGIKRSISWVRVLLIERLEDRYRVTITLVYYTPGLEGPDPNGEPWIYPYCLS